MSPPTGYETPKPRYRVVVVSVSSPIKSFTPSKKLRQYLCGVWGREGKEEDRWRGWKVGFNLFAV